MRIPTRRLESPAKPPAKPSVDRLVCIRIGRRATQACVGLLTEAIFTEAILGKGLRFRHHV